MLLQCQKKECHNRFQKPDLLGQETDDGHNITLESIITKYGKSIEEIKRLVWIIENDDCNFPDFDK